MMGPQPMTSWSKQNCLLSAEAGAAPGASCCCGVLPRGVRAGAGPWRGRGCPWAVSGEFHAVLGDVCVTGRIRCLRRGPLPHSVKLYLAHKHLCAFLELSKCRRALGAMGFCPGTGAAPSSARLPHARWSAGRGRPGTEVQPRLPSVFPAGLSFGRQPGAGFSDPLPATALGRGADRGSTFPLQPERPPHSPLMSRASQVTLLAPRLERFREAGGFAADGGRRPWRVGAHPERGFPAEPPPPACCAAGPVA